MKQTVLYVDKSKRDGVRRSDYEIELEIRKIKKRLKQAGVICKKIFYNYELYMGTSTDSKIMKMIYYMKKEKIDTFVISSHYELPRYLPWSFDDKERILNKINIKICEYSSIEKYFSSDE